MNQRTVLMGIHAAALILAVGAGAAHAQSDAGYPLKRFLGITSFQEVAVAPDGRRIAFITQRDDFEADRQEVAIHRIDVDGSGRPGSILRLTYEPGSYASIRWSPDGRRLAFLSTRGELEAPQLFVLDMRGGEPLRLTEPQRFGKGIAAYDWSPDGGIVFAASDPPSEGDEEEWEEFYGDTNVLPGRTPRTTFWRLVFADSQIRTLDSLTVVEMNVTELAAAPSGERLAFTSGPPTDPEVFYNGFAGREVYLLPLEKGAVARRLTSNLVSEGGLLWASDGRALFAGGLGAPESERTVWTQGRIYSIDPETGDMQRLGADFQGSFSAPSAVLPNGRLLATGNLSTRTNLYAIDAAAAMRISDYAGQVIGPSTSEDGSVLAFALITDRSYPELYVAPGIEAAGRARRATRLNAKIDSLPRPVVEAIAWDNGEGDRIEGVLYWPPGRRGDNGLPLVVDIHGGPWSARTEAIVLNGGQWAYYPALLASRGYLVLEANYRGGTGRGDEFLHAIEGFSCSRPATDILSGVDHLVSQGWADPDRLGVMGYSYGGLLTNCLIARTDRFDAAVSGAGIWNDISYFGTADNFVQNIVRNLNRPPWEAFEEYWRESAASGAGAISTPTIVTIGGADRRVPTAQGYELYRTLVWLDVSARLLVFPGEGHGFRIPSHKLTKVRAEIDWLDSYLLGAGRAMEE